MTKVNNVKSTRTLSQRQVDEMVKAYAEYQLSANETKLAKAKFDALKKKYISDETADDMYYGETGKIKVTHSEKVVLDTSKLREELPEVAEEYSYTQDITSVTVTNLAVPQKRKLLNF